MEFVTRRLDYHSLPHKDLQSRRAKASPWAHFTNWDDERGKWGLKNNDGKRLNKIRSRISEIISTMSGWKFWGVVLYNVQKSSSRQDELVQFTSKNIGRLGHTGWAYGTISSTEDQTNIRYSLTLCITSLDHF